MAAISNHRNISHLRNSGTAWRAAREANINPKKHPFARRARIDYRNPGGVHWRPRRRDDGAMVFREHGKIGNLLPPQASHLLNKS